MKALAELIRGEPVLLRGIVMAVATLVGVKLSSGAVDDWIAVLSPVVLMLLTRPAVTPAVNPVVPTTTAVHVDEAGVETPAELPPMELPPVRTLTHPRTVR